MLWIISWKNNIEASKSRMRSSLIVQHPRKPKLLVNFHMDLLQLMRETKYLRRMGIEVPQSAINVSIQVTSLIAQKGDCEEFLSRRMC